MKGLLILLFVCFTMKVSAQLNPITSMYFINPYQSNPAMAGISKGWELNGALKAQWTAIEGAPVMEHFTAAYGGSGGKVGLGVNLYNEKAGLIARTSMKASYAFHLPLDDHDNMLSLGLSFGMLSERLDINHAKGDLTDETIYSFAGRGKYIDGDFGLAMNYNGFKLQASLPNLRGLLKRDQRQQIADRFLYFASVAYSINLDYDQQIKMEPMFMYRAVEGFRHLWDAGAQVSFSNGSLVGAAIYHSTGSVSYEAGTKYKEHLGIYASYTSDTRDLATKSNGEFGIAIKYNFR